MTNSARLPWKNPEAMNNQWAKIDPTKFCRYHNDTGHTKNDCHQLNDEIETLVRAGPLVQYAQNQIAPNQQVAQNLRLASGIQ